MIQALQIIHESGVVYNDIKLENVMIAKQEKESISIKLIDFGLSTSYLDNTGAHLPI